MHICTLNSIFSLEVIPLHVHGILFLICVKLVTSVDIPLIQAQHGGMEQ